MANARAVPQLILGGVGAALTAAGIITFALTGLGTSFGWIACAPLAEPTWPSTAVLQPGQVLGLVLGFVGSVTLSAAVGFHLGLRRHP